MRQDCTSIHISTANYNFEFRLVPRVSTYHVGGENNFLRTRGNFLSVCATNSGNTFRKPPVVPKSS